MNGTTVAVCVPGADASIIQRLGMAGDEWGLEQVWAGDPRSVAPNSDENYLLPALAGTAAVTVDVRLGAFLTLRAATQILRLAEDIGVVDSASGGRLEIGLVMPEQADKSWEEAASAILGSYHHWPVGSESYPVTPPPQQTWLPRVLVGGNDAIAARLGAGHAVWDGKATLPESAIARRTVLLVDFVASVYDELAQDPPACIDSLRRKIDVAGAHQLVAVLHSTSGIEREIRALGAVVAPAIRCQAREARQIAHDAWSWLTAKGALHATPY